jgi:hypothetical protein
MADIVSSHGRQSLWVRDIAKKRPGIFIALWILRTNEFIKQDILCHFFRAMAGKTVKSAEVACLGKFTPAESRFYLKGIVYG